MLSFQTVLLCYCVSTSWCVLYRVIVLAQVSVFYTMLLCYCVSPSLTNSVLPHDEYCSRAEADVYFVLQFKNRNLKRKVINDINDIFQFIHSLTI